MFGIFISDPVQINLEAQAIRLDSEVTKLTEQVKAFDPKITENLNVFVDYTKLPDYAPSEIEIVIPPNFDPKQLELQGEVNVEEVVEAVSVSPKVEATTVKVAESLSMENSNSPLQASELQISTKALKITQRQTVKQEKSGKADKIAKKFKTKVVAEKFISPSKENGKNLKNNSKVKEKLVAPKEIIQISITDLKPLYESLYPSKQALANLNKEILQEKLEFKKQEDDTKLRKTISAIFEGPTVSADQHTSNSQQGLIIYNRHGENGFGTGGLAFDVAGGQTNTDGAKIQLYHRGTNNKAQIWETEPNTSRIKIKSSGKCLDAGNGYKNGGLVHLWGCHNGGNQQWITHPDGTIRPINNQSFCLDASNGVRNESKVHLWSCHGGSNQNFRMGENDFGSVYRLRIHATKTGWWIPGNPGHALISVGKGSGSIANTFSFWPNQNISNVKYDNDTDWNNQNKINNIASQGDTWIDGPFDIEPAQVWDGIDNSGRKWRYSGLAIPKNMYDQIAYMRGWKLDGYDNNYYVVLNSNSKICSTYSMNLWNKFIGPYNGVYFGSGHWTPSQVYSSISS